MRLFHHSMAALLFSLLLCLHQIDAAALSLEEKVGQLLMVHFHGEAVNRDAKALVQETGVGGIIYYNWANGLCAPEQVHSLSEGLQELALENPVAIPLLIAVDQEGGVVTRLSQGFTLFPGNKALGMTGDPSLAAAAALSMGRELRTVGVNMNLAPVVDVNSNPHNPIIGIRAFGDEPGSVVSFGREALKGYRDAGIIAVLKHFPGHGDVAVDSHEALPVVHKSLERLSQEELLPFMELAAAADAIMTAHILVPALDPDSCTTFSQKSLSYLRDTIGFQGCIISDSLVMKGAKQTLSIDEVAIRALNAGCDILLLGGRLLSGEEVGKELTIRDIQHIHRSIVDAVARGDISEARIDEALDRVLTLKKRCCGQKEAPSELKQWINSEEHQALAKRIAQLALRVKDNGTIPPPSLKGRKVAIFAPQMITPIPIIEGSPYIFEALNPSSEEIETAKLRAKDAELLIVFSYNAWKNPAQEQMIRALLATEKPLILVATRDPLDGELFPQAACVVNTFSPVEVSIQAAIDLLLR